MTKAEKAKLLGQVTPAVAQIALVRISQRCFSPGCPRRGTHFGWATWACEDHLFDHAQELAEAPLLRLLEGIAQETKG